MNGNLNPLWVQLTRTKSGSGHNFNAVIEGIRLFTWPMECIIRAQNNTRTTLSRQRKSTTTSHNNTQDPEDSSNPLGSSVGVGGGGGDRGEDEVEEVEGIQSIAYKEIYANQFKKVFIKTKVDMYYPTYWLSFLLIGRPAQKDGRPVLEAGKIIILLT